MLSALPYLGCWLLSMGGGQLADYLRETCLFRTVAVRKAFTVIGEELIRDMENAVSVKSGYIELLH